MSKLDISRASRETLEALALECHSQWGDPAIIREDEMYPEEGRLVDKLRAECTIPEPKLRTRAEVDADIVAVIRRFWSAYAPRKGDRLDWDSLGSYSESRDDLNRLCAEPVAEPPETKPCKDPCGCPASDELRELVASLETELSVTRGGHRYWRQKASAIPVDREEFDRVKVATRTLIRCMRELRQTPGAFVASQLATIEEALR